MQVKDWTGNSHSTFSTIGASNHSLVEREDNDFYATDPKALELLLEKEHFDHFIWECACGKGHLSEVLRKHGYIVRSTDLIDRGYLVSVQYENVKSKNKMKVLSLYDGMACGALALQAAGIEIENYDAFEIDKYAIKTSSHNFPFIKHHGDVFNADFTQFKGVDLVCGGSPCTYWSIAQKNNRETEASGEGWRLFKQFVRAVKEARPQYFVYENNKSMSKAIRASIDEMFGFEAVLINSALVSAQNRQRLYWVGRRCADSTYRKVDVPLPEDRGIMLKDILIDGIVEKDKAYCLKHQAGNARDYFKKHHTNVKFEPVLFQRPRGKNNGGAKFEKAPTMTANGCYQENVKVVEPIRIGEMPQQNGELSKHQSKQYRVYSTEGKSTSLCGQGGGLGAKTGLYALPITSETIYAVATEFDENGEPIKAISYADGKEYKVYKVENGLIPVNGKQYPIKLTDGYYIIRKLTVRECARLQTVPEWYEFPVSDTQAYKMLGNGWTVDVIAHIFSFLKE